MLLDRKFFSMPPQGTPSVKCGQLQFVSLQQLTQRVLSLPLQGIPNAGIMNGYMS